MRLALPLTILLLAGCGSTTEVAPLSSRRDAGWDQVAGTFGAARVQHEGEVLAIDAPREDLDVRDGSGVKLLPAMGVGSHARFAGEADDAFVAGAACVTLEEVQPVIDALRRGGLDVVGVHDRWLGERPDLRFVHFQGRGEALALARAVRAAWDLLGQVHDRQTHGAQDGLAAYDPQRVLKALALPAARLDQGAVVVSVPRPLVDAWVEDRLLPPRAAVRLQAAFAACDACGATATTGEVGVRRAELQDTIDLLRAGGLRVSAIHAHVLTDEPLVVVHWTGEGEGEELARAVRALAERLRAGTSAK